MKLFTFSTSPYARKVRMMLDLKGVGYEPIERCYSLDRKPDLPATSQRAEVPVLVLDDKRTIADSTIIAEYIEQAWPKPALFPADPWERARMRTIEDLCDRAFDSVSFGYWYAVVRESEHESAAMKLAARREFEALLLRLESELGARDYFCGALSLADLAAVTYVPAASAMGIDLGATPRLASWLARMREIPAVKADLARVADAMAHMTSMLSEFEGPDGRVHWRDSRLEWPVRHGFIDLVAREFHANKMMFPPEAS
jgi:glutathione S-transferase